MEAQSNTSKSMKRLPDLREKAMVKKWAVVSWQVNSCNAKGVCVHHDMHVKPTMKFTTVEIMVQTGVLEISWPMVS